MDNRREFIKKAALLSGGTGLLQGLPPSIQKAFAINPAPGTTYLDAEHIVFLMQENRSFDHCFGTLQGVRGFNDPRAITLPNKNKVWAQTNAAGESYAPFRLDIKESKITWLGSLPHGWSDMTDARNEGRHDKWLDAKKSNRRDCTDLPLTMGYYNREDIPFYYALADAFTVCDQHFCSSLTGTTPNRLYFWTGTIREKQDGNLKANVYNHDVNYNTEVSWKTFPEYLEENNISWNIYQNEISLPTGFTGEEDNWLANFTDNPIEWFSQYNVRFSQKHQEFAAKMKTLLPASIAELEAKIKDLPELSVTRVNAERELAQKRNQLKEVEKSLEKYSVDKYNQLSETYKNLHKKAFSDNRNDPDYRQLASLTYTDGTTERTMKIPKGDVLHQFRQDVKTGKLPTVSWIVAPSNFSDHPGSPWYGAWYLSEVIDILTQNPEVWKKTIFILNYDENDGYFDHIPPFVAPNPYKPNSGKVSEGIDPAADYVSKTQQWMKDKQPSGGDREGPVGLGYRVPMIVASPWSRGGYVCSEVFDLTSPIQFMEHFLSKKTGKKIQSEQITPWRRTVSGDITSVFRPYNGEKILAPKPVVKEAFLESIHKAQFKQMPAGYHLLSAADVEALNKNPQSFAHMARQEKGTRPSCGLPYQLHSDGRLNEDRKSYRVKLEAKNELFGERTAGAPFYVYTALDNEAPRQYAVKAGDSLFDDWQTDAGGNYHLKLYGPNGFYREFAGNNQQTPVDVLCEYEKTGSKTLSGNIELKIRNNTANKITVEVTDNAYKTKAITKTLAANAQTSLVLPLGKSSRWYDFSVKVKDNASFENRFAGRVETGKAGITDPLMGGVV